ncbi:hypothetical protein BS78_02G199000 [Paspalum vaginatum]|nr:hypothetical protein BS78_02G199000 [Paspalum vaginatum]
MEPEMQAALVKGGVFVLVQALVYLILSQSSSVFSRTKTPARLLSSSRVLAMLSDLPLAGEPSPVAAFARTRSFSPMLDLAADWKEDWFKLGE